MVFSLEVIEGNSQVNNIFITNCKVDLLIMFMRPLCSYFIARRKLGSCEYIILVPMARRKRSNMSGVL